MNKSEIGCNKVLLLVVILTMRRAQVVNHSFVNLGIARKPAVMCPTQLLLKAVNLN